MSSVKISQIVDYFVLNLFADFLLLKVVVHRRHLLQIQSLLSGLRFDDHSDFVHRVGEDAHCEIDRYHCYESLDKGGTLEGGGGKSGVVVIDN